MCAKKKLKLKMYLQTIEFVKNKSTQDKSMNDCTR